MLAKTVSYQYEHTVYSLKRVKDKDEVNILSLHVHVQKQVPQVEIIKFHPSLICESLPAFRFG